MYEPTMWVDDKSPDVNEDNMNKIEQGIKAAHDMAEHNAENIAKMAGNQMPEEYLKKAVDNYVKDNSGGFATQVGMAELESQLSGQIESAASSLNSEIADLSDLTTKAEKTYTPITPTAERSGSYASCSGVGGTINIVTDSNFNRLVQDGLIEGQKYRIFCSWYQNFSPYYFCSVDPNGGTNYCISGDFEISASAWTTGYLEVTVPSGATRLFVNAFLHTPTLDFISEDGKVAKAYSKEETYSKEEIDNMLKGDKKPVVVFNFDQSALDERYTILEEYCFSATFAEGTEEVTKTLVKHGFDICPYLGNHTLSHTSEEAIQALTSSIATKKAELESWGLYNPIMCLCSGHKWTYALEQALINNDYNNFHYVRCGARYDENNNETYTSTNALPSDRFQYPITMESYSVNDIKGVIDSFVANKRPLIMLMMHKFTENGGSDISKAEFIEVVEYVKTLVDNGTVECMNMRQYYAYHYPKQAKEDDRTRIFSALMDKSNS